MMLILPPLDSPAHPVVTVRLSSIADAAIWDHYQRIMDELGMATDDQQAVYGALGQVLGQAYAAADDDEHTHVAAVDVGPYHVLWQSRTSGYEAADPEGATPVFLMPMPEPTPTPTPSPSPRRTPRPTATASPKPSLVPQAPAPSDWVCNGVSTAIQDPLSKGWHIKRIDWGNKGNYDRLTITLDQSGKGGDGTQAIVHVMPMEDVEPTLKVTAPSEGTKAIAIGMYQDVRLTWSIGRALTMSSLEWITMGKDNNGFPWVVLGVDDEACYSLQVPVWTANDPKSKTPIQITVDVKR